MRYKYYCENCKEEKEREYPIGKAPSYIKCDKCNKRCYRSFSPISILYKGKGFHNTDYKGGKNET